MLLNGFSSAMKDAWMTSSVLYLPPQSQSILLWQGRLLLLTLTSLLPKTNQYLTIVAEKKAEKKAQMNPIWGFIGCFGGL